MLWYLLASAEAGYKSFQTGLQHPLASSRMGLGVDLIETLLYWVATLAGMHGSQGWGWLRLDKVQHSLAYTGLIHGIGKGNCELSQVPTPMGVYKSPGMWQ